MQSPITPQPVATPSSQKPWETNNFPIETVLAGVFRYLALYALLPGVYVGALRAVDIEAEPGTFLRWAQSKFYGSWFLVSPLGFYPMLAAFESGKIRWGQAYLCFGLVYYGCVFFEASLETLAELCFVGVVIVAASFTAFPTDSLARNSLLAPSIRFFAFKSTAGLFTGTLVWLGIILGGGLAASLAAFLFGYVITSAKALGTILLLAVGMYLRHRHSKNKARAHSSRHEAPQHPTE